MKNVFLTMLIMAPLLGYQCYAADNTLGTTSPKTVYTNCINGKDIDGNCLPDSTHKGNVTIGLKAIGSNASSSSANTGTNTPPLGSGIRGDSLDDNTMGNISGERTKSGISGTGSAVGGQ